MQKESYLSMAEEKRKEIQSRVVCAGPCLQKPTIICCIREKQPQHLKQGDRNKLLSTGPKEQMMKVEDLYPGPIYMLKKQVRVLGVTMSVLDVLDIRNAFFWTDTFRQKIIENRWDEMQCHTVFYSAISKDIVHSVIGDVPTLRDAVRKIYDRVYTPAGIADLERKISNLRALHFESLEAFSEELLLLIKASSVCRMLSPEKIQKMHRDLFWQGLPDDVRNKLQNRIAPDAGIESLIKGAKSMRYSLIYGSEPSKESAVPVHLPEAVSEDKENDPVNEPPVTITAKDGVVLQETGKAEKTRKKTKKKHRGGKSKDKKEAVTPPKLQGMFGHESRIIDMIYAIHSGVYLAPGERFVEPIPCTPFVIEVAVIGNVFGSVLYQEENVPISFFSMELVGEEANYTATEKEVLAINQSSKYFGCVTQGSTVNFRTTRYRSFQHEDVQL